MQVPLQIVFEHVPPSEAIEQRLREESFKLEEFFSRITSMRVVVGRPQRRHQKGDCYTIRLHITLPGAPDIAISRDPSTTGRHEDIQVSITDAFDAAKRKLQDWVRIRQGQVKTHEPVPRGVITSLIAEKDYGFITSSDGREVYFHKNSVEGDKFYSLAIGQSVRFAEDQGEKGPQATFVHPLCKMRSCAFET